MTEVRQRSALSLIGWVALCLAAGGLGSVVTLPKIPIWYVSLAKPWWTPPNWVFGPVWITLYVLMGIAAWMVWSAWTRRVAYISGNDARTGLWWFGAQLVLNVAWSFVFFELERPDAAFAEIVLLWIGIAGTIVFFRRVQPVAAWLLVPYLVWVSFAAGLNLAIWRLNA